MSNGINLTAGVWYHLPVSGHYVRILSGDGDITVRASTGVEQTFAAGLQVRMSEESSGEPFRELLLKSATTQEIELLVSAYPIDDDRIVGDVVTRATRPDARSYNKVNVPAGTATQLLSADAARAGAVIKASKTIWIGPDNTVDGTDATGWEVPAGDIVSDENTGELWAYSSTTAASVYVLSESHS